MKRLLLVLLAATSMIAFADDLDCVKASSDTVLKRLDAKSRTEFTINYSADNEAKANTCKAAINAKNSKITVKMNKVDGTGKFKFSK